MSGFGQAMEQAAPWSFAMLAVLVFLVATLVERTVFLLVKAQINLPELLAMVRKLADAGNADRAVKLCAAVPSPVGRVCRVGLEGIGKDPFSVTEELDQVIAAELPALRRRMGTIPLLSLGVAAVGVVASVLGGTPAPGGAESGLPFGLGEQHVLALVGVAAGIVGLLWWLFLAAKVKRVASDLERCKAFSLEISAMRR